MLMNGKKLKHYSKMIILFNFNSMYQLQEFYPRDHLFLRLILLFPLVETLTYHISSQALL